MNTGIYRLSNKDDNDSKQRNFVNYKNIPSKNQHIKSAHQGKRIINNLSKVCAKERFLRQKHSDCCARVSGQFYSYFATIRV